jgi:hypothetical protein
VPGSRLKKDKGKRIKDETEKIRVRGSRLTFSRLKLKTGLRFPGIIGWRRFSTSHSHGSPGKCERAGPIGGAGADTRPSHHRCRADLPPESHRPRLASRMIAPILGHEGRFQTPLRFLFQVTSALLSLKVFAACANFPAASDYPKRGFARAKTPRTPSPEVNFFAAFASLREIFRVWLRLLPR